MIHREDRDSVAILKMNHDEGNLVDSEFVNALEQSIDEVVESNVRALVITGHGSIFIEGGNLFEIAKGGATYVKAFIPKFSALVKRLFTLPLPTVAAINGNAFISGYVLAAACDLRVMTTGKATIGIQGLAFGHPLEPTPLEVLHFQIPTADLQDMADTGRLVGPSEALEIGLVDELASPDRVVDRAVELASQLGTIPNEAFVQTKQQIRQPTVERIEQYAAKWDADVIAYWTSAETLARDQKLADQLSEQQKKAQTTNVPGGAGSSDGKDATAHLNQPVGVAVDAVGNVYVGDFGSHTIRKITPSGVMSTLAGAIGEAGSTDGTGSTARFNGPRGVALDSARNVYVADNLNNTIRKVTPDGVVSTLAGLAGEAGSSDGRGSAARFNSPMGMAIDSAGTIYVADFNSSTIREVTPDGVVSTLAGSAGKTGSRNGRGSTARFNHAGGLAVDSTGTIYVGDSVNHTVRKITPSGVVSTLAGSAGKTGSRDGKGKTARFKRTGNPAVDSEGNVYVADNENNTIRKITPSGVVSTLAGSAGETGSRDGTGSAARFNSPIGVAIDSEGNLYAADNLNNTIRKITPSGVVSTLVGLPSPPLASSPSPPLTSSSAQPATTSSTPPSASTTSTRTPSITNIIANTINSAARLVPGGEIAREVAVAGTLGAVEGATWLGNEFAKAGRNLAGRPGEISAALLGASAGATIGFFLGSTIGSRIGQNIDYDPAFVALAGRNPRIAPSIIFDPGYVPDAGHSVGMEEVFSVNTVGTIKFGEDVQYTYLQDDLYNLTGKWVGLVTGLLLSHTPASRLFQAPPPPQGAIDRPPVPRQDVTEWTNGYYVFADGSTIITEGISRTHFVPLKDGSILFTVTNSHVITDGSGVYEGVQGIKQGIGAAIIPPGQIPGKFPAPGLEAPSDQIDTFRFIKKGFLNPQNELGQEKPKEVIATSASATWAKETGAGDQTTSSDNPTIVSYLLDNPLLRSVHKIAKEIGVLPFNLALPNVPGSVPEFYEDSELFRRYSVGEGEISADRKYFSFKGECFLLNQEPDGYCQGIYEFSVPLSSLGETPPPAKPPFNLQTLSINKITPQAFSKESWHFADGSSLTVVGPALLHAAEILTEETDFWISASQLITNGTGRFEGAGGVKTTGLSIMVPANESLQTATKVTFKTIDLFVVIRKEFIGELQLPQPGV